MVGVSDLFQCIGQDGCMDVATSLAMQGCDILMEQEIDIPIYEIFHLKIMFGDNVGELGGTIPEYNALNKLAKTCGAVSASINILDIDLLTIAGITCIATPNTGMNVFCKVLNVMTDLIDGPIAQQLLSVTPLGAIPGLGIAPKMICDALEWCFNFLVDALGNELEPCGIALHTWDELPDFYNQLKASGEMAQMQEYRMEYGAASLAN